MGSVLITRNFSSFSSGVMFSKITAAKKRCAKIFKKGMIRRSFRSRIIAIIKALVQNINTSSSTFALAGILSILLASSDQTILTGFNQSPADPKTDESEEQVENPASTNENDDVEDEEQCEKCAIMYVRVSSSEQESEGTSLESQEKELTSIIEKDQNMRAYTPEAIRDGGETGTNFDRDGIQKVLELAQEDDPTHLLVDSIDRIGRNIVDTLHYIQVLREKCGVKIMARSREFDILKPSDKMQLSILALMADFGTMTRARSSRRSKVDNFLDKNWFSWYRSVPMGYEADDDDSDDDENVWIVPIDELEPVIKEIYKLMKDERSYEEVGRIITARHRGLLERHDLIHEQTETEDKLNNRLNGQQIKRVLTNPVYIGKPVVPVTDLEHHTQNPQMEDQDLQLVSEESYNEVQDIVADIKEKNSTQSEQTIEPLDYNQQFGAFAVDAASPTVQLLCPKCDEELISNGQTTISGDLAFRHYSCSNEGCDYGRRWPKQKARETMKLLKDIEEYELYSSS